jgi:Cu-Zn family superoxide dismutase
MRLFASLLTLAIAGPALAQTHSHPAPAQATAQTAPAAPATAPAPAQAAPEGIETIQAPLIGPTGAPVGQIQIRGSANATVVRITVNPGTLRPGWHGAHFHAVGDCSDHGQFQASKGHVNNLVKKHGLLHAEGPDEGDLPNVYAAPDGSVNAEVSSLAIRVLGPNGLKDADGSALVIHANEDDHYNQPIGNAGGRIACAVIR